jgi:hypothetical protein
MALNFDTEWAKFDSDFIKLKRAPVAAVKPVEVVIPTPPLSSKNTQNNVIEQVDPKSPDRLGHKLSDPVMRDRVIEAYNKPNAVVYSLTLTE